MIPAPAERLDVQSHSRHHRTASKLNHVSSQERPETTHGAGSAHKSQGIRARVPQEERRMLLGSIGAQVPMAKHLRFCKEVSLTATRFPPGNSAKPQALPLHHTQRQWHRRYSDCKSCRANPCSNWITSCGALHFGTLGPSVK